MNTKYKMLLKGIEIFFFSVCCSIGIVAAGEITYSDNAFTSGNTLNASDLNTKFNEIKQQVNDNNSRITQDSIDLTNHNTDPNAHPGSIYFGGDGSAGDITINSATNWDNTAPTNPNFRNFIIETGQTLTIPAGTTIRCSGKFVNNGTINVLLANQTVGAGFASTSIGGTKSNINIGHPGDTLAAATTGDYTNDQSTLTSYLYSGMGGKGIPKAKAVSSFNSFSFGGGSGAGIGSGNGGGGLLKIYCKGDITNNGPINANGDNGLVTSGGGGGGIVVIGSMSSITLSASAQINVRGGNGGARTEWGGPGGGGGGGIIILVSLNTKIDSGAKLDISSGTGSNGGTDPLSSISGRTAGGGGGASGGSGGRGGQILVTDVPSDAYSGAYGYILDLNINPATMMF